MPREKARSQRLAYYLADVTRSGDLSLMSALLAWKAWNDLKAASGNLLPVPDASPGPDDQVLYTWNNGEHYLELEVFPEGSAEFFYRNRESGQLWEYEYTVGAVLPQDVNDKLALFFQV